MKHRVTIIAIGVLVAVAALAWFGRDWFAAGPTPVAGAKGDAKVEAKADPKAVQALVGNLTWKADFIWNEATKPPPMPNVGGMLTAIFELTGLLLVICVGGGICFAGGHYVLRQRRMRLHGSDGGGPWGRWDG